MTTRALLVAAGLLAATLTPAFADSVTAVVADWDQVTRSITLEDRSQFADIPAEVTVPKELQTGQEITVDYYADEDGIQAINAITINRDVAKRLLPNDKRG
jgi:predicted Zn-dependent protease